MRGSSSRPVIAAGQPSHFSRRPASASRPSGDLAGRTVKISIDVPSEFDAPLAPHHKVIGGWAAVHKAPAVPFTRPAARRYIERAFDEAVLAVLGRVELADLRAAVLIGEDGLPPAIAIVCDSMGQIDLGWIEKSNVLANTLFTKVAPVGWRAAAYRAIVEALVGLLPVFTYEDLFEEISASYWDGETDDEAARKAMIEWHGYDPQDVDGMTMPSEMNERRPDFMLAENAARMKDMPAGLCQKLRALREAHQAMTAVKSAPERNAWHFAFDRIVEYLPDFEDRSHLAPMTLVPFDIFARELDDAAQHGMQTGFMDVAGICQLTDAGRVSDWLASLQTGVDVLLAAQDLIDFDPANQ